MARWVRRRAPAGRVLAVASQKRGVLEHFGITRAEADREAWTIDRSGRRLGGAAAINRVLTEIGDGWGLVARLFGLRPIAALERAAYRWFAGHRSRFHRLGVRPECDEPGADCQ